MSTIQQTNDETVTFEQQSPPPLESLFSFDQNGECVTEEGLDWIWPEDDRTPVDIGGKGVKLPHTCVEFVPCYQKYGEEACLKFVFNGSTIPLQAQVPLGDAGVFAITAIAALAAVKLKGFFA